MRTDFHTQTEQPTSAMQHVNTKASHHHSRSWPWRTIWPAAAILSMTAIAYLPAMSGGFIWDDDAYVTQNPLLTAPDGLQRIWFSLHRQSQYFPLTYTTL